MAAMNFEILSITVLQSERAHIWYYAYKDIGRRGLGWVFYFSTGNKKPDSFESGFSN